MMRLKSAVLCLSIFTLTSTTLTFAQRNSPGHSGQNEKQVPKKGTNAKQGTKPEWGTSVKTAPARTTTIKSKQNMAYHYREGVYYQPSQGGSYKVGPAPVGIRIKTLPKGFTKVLLGGISYFYYYGTFYRNADQSSYEVVIPPIGAVVYDLPSGYEKISLEGFTYYTFEGIYYKTIIDSNGEVAYQVVGDIRG